MVQLKPLAVLLSTLFLIVPLTSEKSIDVHYCDRIADYVVKVSGVDISPFPVPRGKKTTFTIAASTALNYTRIVKNDTLSFVYVVWLVILYLQSAYLRIAREDHSFVGFLCFILLIQRRHFSIPACCCDAVERRLKRTPPCLSAYKAISGGKLEIDVFYFGIHVHNENHDLCKEISCPVSVGDFVLSHSLKLSRLTPPGSYVFKMTMEDENNKRLTCITFDFSIGFVAPESL
ncbi:UNVERIFIED_CONTAM: putative phosphatidylglycerol/phosphatidylinositol transfer protein DDB [Sesamum latifolium]|uniref:Phosphatidylglycerol/phosphatidylinositol transfer protein DDB n=1 Tax=Sesamum latifolium TaxID=2727402 RepID=A0AAW2VCE0_9LAMI